MARKDLLKTVLGSHTNTKGTEGGRTDYAMRGASKAMRVSIDTLAENSRRLLEGETIVEIDPALIDVSFVSDRLSGDDEAYQELKQSIRDGQQDSPALLRPHPSMDGRYMTVFGHRRVRVAKELGRMVRAVIKPMDDIAHVLAQGQENTARADLSFIEKAVFAKRLLDHGQSKDVIQSALTIDGTLLSRMTSVAGTIPDTLIHAIGPAKQIGRDRWEAMKKLLGHSDNIAVADAVTRENGFAQLDSTARFELVHSRLSGTGIKPKARSRRKAPQRRAWTANNGRIKGVIGRAGKAFTISLTAQDSAEFGTFIEQRLDALYQSYLEENQENEQ